MKIDTSKLKNFEEERAEDMDCISLVRYLKLKAGKELELPDDCIDVPIEICDETINVVFKAIVGKKPFQIIPQTLLTRKYCFFQ